MKPKTKYYRYALLELPLIYRTIRIVGDYCIWADYIHDMGDKRVFHMNEFMPVRGNIYRLINEQI